MIRLSWPPKELSPNARVHWAAKSRRTKAYRNEGLVVAQSVRSLVALPEDGPIPMVVTFYPPDHRARDDDNMIASFKAARDGVAQGLRVDDARFAPRYQFGEPVNGGAVVLTIGGAE